MKLADYEWRTIEIAGQKVNFARRSHSIRLPIKLIISHLKASAQSFFVVLKPARNPHVLTLEEWQARQWWTKARHYAGALLTAAILWVIIVAFVWVMAILAEVMR